MRGTAEPPHRCKDSGNACTVSNIESLAVDVAFVGSVPKSLKPSILFDRDYPIAMEPWKTYLWKQPPNASNSLLLGGSGALGNYT